MIRRLGHFEQALTLSSQHAPFNVIVILKMENAPAPESVQKAMEMLQRRHPFLRAAIHKNIFEAAPNTTLPLRVLERRDDSQWRELVEQEMNTWLEQGLWRCTYLLKNKHAEIILTFHHAILDAASGMKLLDELMRACSGSLPELPALEPVPPVEERFPPAFSSWRAWLPTLKYAAAQMGDEMAYWWRVRGKRVPPVHPGGRGFVSTLLLPESLVDALSRRCRKEGLTLNSLLNAALALAANRHLYGGQNTPMRTFTFADLRPYTVPPTAPENLANYISMLRFTLDVAGKDNLWDLAKTLHAKIYPALKQGDKFIASAMSKSLIKMFNAIKSIRMGSVALNYGGAVPLQTVYGEIKVTGLHGFLSSYDLAPEVSSQARLFNDQLWWDFIFLDSDMGRDLAEEIVGEVKLILEKAGEG